MILKIYVDDHFDKGIDVPVTPQSTVSDILECCRLPYSCQFQLVETWRNHERVVGADERLFEILMHWGAHQDEVRFRLRQNRGNSDNENSIDFSSSLDRALMAGKDMTYQEMQDRVIQQRRLIERQQQMILAKEQRLRFLRQQEHLHQQQKARSQTSEPVGKHEKKLQQLKSARGEDIGPTSANQETENQLELESYKQVFNVTEKQLSLIIGKTDVLAKHLQDFQSTRCEPSISEECQRLRAELLLRKTLNDEQNSKIVSHNQKLVRRKEEIALLDAKIALLQNRLHISKLQKQNEKNGHSFSTAVATVESCKHTDVRSTVPSDVLKPPSMVESRYQSVPPGKTLPLAAVNKAVTSGYEKENGFARSYLTAGLEENEQVTAMSKSLIESRGNTTAASEYGKMEKPNTRPRAVTSPSVNTMASVGISSGFRASSPQVQPSAVPAMVADREPTALYTMATTTPTVTWKNGPTFEKQPASSPDVPPTRFMPPFTASVVLPSKISQGIKPVYAMSGSGDARQSKESSSFRSSPSGRIHFDANPFQAPSAAAGARRLASPSGKTSGVVATTTGDEVDGGNANVYYQQNDPRATNNLIPMTYVKQQTVPLDFKDQNLRTGTHAEGDARAPMSIESHKSLAGDYKSVYSDAQTRSSQPRFASMSVITDTYFRKPGSGIDTRKAGEFAERNPRRHRNTDDFIPNPVSGISAGRPVTSSAALIRPAQNNVRSSSTPPTVDARLARTSDNYGFQARRNEAQIAVSLNRPSPVAGKPLDMPVSFSRSGFPSRDNTVAQMPLTSGISSEATSSSQHRFPYRVDRPNPGNLIPTTQLASKSRSYDVTDHTNAPMQSQGKRISFSDEQFFPTGDALYKLDGYGAYYHAMRHSGDPEKSPGHVRMNAPKALRRRLSGDSNDDSLIRPAKYQQNRLVAETTLNAARPVMGISIPESPQSHPPDDFPERDLPQYLRNFTPFVPPSSSPGYAGASQENQISSVTSSRSFPTDISPSFSDNLARVLDSPVVTKPPETPILPTTSVHPNISLTPIDSRNSLDPSTNDSDPISISGEYNSDSQASSSTPSLHIDGSLSPVTTVSSQSDDTRNLISPLKDFQSDPPKDGFDENRNSGGGGEVDLPLEGEPEPVAFPTPESNASKQSNLKKSRSGRRTANRVTFDPMVLLLDACLEGELETVKKTTKQVEDPSMPNDEGITALHNAICAGHFEIVKFLVEYGCDVNAADTDGWTPLHCSASCNNLEMTRLLVENGACVFAVTTSDQETASEKCERDEEGFETCHKYLLDMEEKLGKSNHGSVYALYDYTALDEDELGFQCGDKITVLRKGDDVSSQWWFSRLQKKEGYVPRNYLGAYPRVAPKWNSPK